MPARVVLLGTVLVLAGCGGSKHESAQSTTTGSSTNGCTTVSAPKAAASMFALAKNRFFDQTIVHRVATGFVVQGGDPTGSGMGGPGYSTEDTPARSTRYTRGVVAMAKTQTDPPGTAGSQWFVVTADDAGLPAEYAVIGEVTGGYDAIERMDKLGTQSQEPSKTIVVERVVAEQS